MSEKEESGFSWLTLFMVTGFSGFIFDLVIHILDGYHSPFLIWGGTIALLLGLMNLLLSYVARRASGKDKS